MPGFPVLHYLQEFAQIQSVMPSNHLILCHPLLLPPSIFPSIRVFSNESVLRIRWPNIGVSASASVLPMNIQDWFPLGWTRLISLQSKGLSRVFSSTTVQKHQFGFMRPPAWWRRLRVSRGPQGLLHHPLRSPSHTGVPTAFCSAALSLPGPRLGQSPCFSISCLLASFPSWSVLSVGRKVHEASARQHRASDKCPAASRPRPGPQSTCTEYRDELIFKWFSLPGEIKAKRISATLSRK